jgi:hypothetical protein
MWKMVSACFLWCLWRERNGRCFDDRERILEEIKSFFLLKSVCFNQSNFLPG